MDHMKGHQCCKFPLLQLFVEELSGEGPRDTQYLKCEHEERVVAKKRASSSIGSATRRYGGVTKYATDKLVTEVRES
jgi:hypothetical protein